jgi:hypothetical protein
MSIQATILSQPITATVTGDTISASVPASQPVQASVSGGMGPQGPQGVPGQTVTTLDQLTDVVAATPSENDVLRYESGVWKNEQLVLNGGNF